MFAFGLDLSRLEFGLMEVGDFVGVFVSVARTNHVEIEEAVVAEVDIGEETAVFVALILALVKDQVDFLIT